MQVVPCRAGSLYTGIMTSAKGKHLLKQLSHPGTPRKLKKKKDLLKTFCFFFFKYFIYLTDRETGRGSISRAEGKGEAGFPLSREPDVGLHPRTLGSWPEMKAEALTRWATQVPLIFNFKIKFKSKYFFLYFHTFFNYSKAFILAYDLYVSQVFFKILFIYLTERDHKQAERGRCRLPTEQRAWCGAWSQDPEIMTWAEGRGFNPLSHPGAQLYSFFKKDLYIWASERIRGRGKGRGRDNPTQTLW